jgi:hypothetical protein
MEALREAQLYRTDRLGTVDLVSDGVSFRPTY